MSFRSPSAIFALIFSSSMEFFTLKQYDSRLFFAAILSFCDWSSAWYLSASFTIRSMSSLLSRPLSLVIIILFSLFVDFSTADTFKIPFASMSKVTWEAKEWKKSERRRKERKTTLSPLFCSTSRGPDAISIPSSPSTSASAFRSDTYPDSLTIPIEFHPTRTLVATGRKEISRHGIVWKGSLNPVQS